jgi:hypothetical protein
MPRCQLISTKIAVNNSNNHKNAGATTLLRVETPNTKATLMHMPEGVPIPIMACACPSFYIHKVSYRNSESCAETAKLPILCLFQAPTSMRTAILPCSRPARQCAKAPQLYVCDCTRCPLQHPTAQLLTQRSQPGGCSCVRQAAAELHHHLAAAGARLCWQTAAGQQPRALLHVLTAPSFESIIHHCTAAIQSLRLSAADKGCVHSLAAVGVSGRLLLSCTTTLPLLEPDCSRSTASGTAARPTKLCGSSTTAS